MTYDLYIGDRLFSSWSLRGWLLFKMFGISCRVHMVGLYSGTMADDLAPLAPARLVPAARLPDGTAVGETLAIAETLAERHPEAGLWPDEAGERATARWLCAEMAAGFSALRGECPMQLARLYSGFAPSAATEGDLRRLETLWSHARGLRADRKGPWLFDRFCVADVFFLPVAIRIRGYGLQVDAAASAYVDALLSLPELADWHRAAQTVHYDPMPYDLDLPFEDWSPAPAAPAGWMAPGYG